MSNQNKIQLDGCGCLIIAFFAPAILFCATEWLDFFSESKTAYQLWRERVEIKRDNACGIGRRKEENIGMFSKTFPEKSSNVESSNRVDINGLATESCVHSVDTDVDGLIEVNHPRKQYPVFLEKLFEFFGRIAPWGIFGGYKANIPENECDAEEYGNDKHDANDCSFFDDDPVDSNLFSEAFVDKNTERGSSQPSECNSRSGGLNCG